jgi:type IV pilus biogenesis protein CpaD/CtpE
MHMDMLRTFRIIAVSGSLFAVAGCASGPSTVENDFGNSVRHMTQAQVANPAAPVDNDPIDHGDGPRINAAIDVYRKSVSDPKEIKQDIVIGVDQ